MTCKEVCEKIVSEWMRRETERLAARELQEGEKEKAGRHSFLVLTVP